MTQDGSAQQAPTRAGTGSGLSWPAVSAVAASAAAVVALIAYLAPPTAPPQPPPQPDGWVPTSAPRSSSPDPATTPPPPDPSTPEPPAPSSTRAAPVTSAALPPIRPAGCDEATAALNTYRRNAGTTRSSQAAAAQQTYSDLMGAALDAQGAVGTNVRGLAMKFRELNFRLTGMVARDPNQVIDDINADVSALNRLCSSP